MSRAEHAPQLPTGPAPDSALDPELEALPKPRRPGRLLTIAAMSLTLLAAGFMAVALRGEALYALARGEPAELGDLHTFRAQAALANRWVHGEGSLSKEGVRYSRPLEPDSYRLSPIAGNERLWVQVRVPEGLENPEFVPPASFVGRLVPIAEAGLRYQGLRRATRMPKDAWLLIDGEAPHTSRWALGLCALFALFAAFNVYGLIRLLRPIHNA